MATFITLPPSLDEHGFEDVLEQLSSTRPTESVIVDARQCTFATAFGLPALLAIAGSRAPKPTLLLPSASDTLRYWTAVGFLRCAEGVFTVIHASPPTAASEMADVFFPLRSHEPLRDGQPAAALVQDRALRILTGALGIDARISLRLAMAIGELCQAAVERSPGTASAMLEALHFKKRLAGCPIAIIAVCFTGAQCRTNAARPTGPESRRDRHVRALRELTNGVDGKLSVRTGTSRWCIVPSWDVDVPSSENLALFPGTILQLIVPGRVVA
jgi:hypothetical protein